MILVEPEQRIRQQIAAYFIAAIVEDQRAPIGMLALSRIGVLVAMRTVEEHQHVPVSWAVSRRPVEDDAKAGLVAGIDEIHEVRRSAEAAGGREVSDGLVAPGTVEGMLHNGQQFNVREAQLLHYGDELRSQLAIGEKAI